MTTAIAEPQLEIRPQPGPQEMFLSSAVDVCIYGGAAGGGKTFALLMEPLYYIDNSHFNAVIYRYSYPQIKDPGGMWDESMALYPLVGGTANESSLEWRFPSGAKIAFRHMGQPGKVEMRKGLQSPLIEFDQLEEHPERVFFYMFTRNRSTSGIPARIRATVNPDPDSFVARFIEWWIDEDTGLPIEERAGQVRWFARQGEKWLWADTRMQLLQENPTLKPEQPKSVTFIPAKLEDNRILMESDPGYLANLLAQDYVDQQRLLFGNWKVKASAGKVYARSWFSVVDAAPAGGIWCRGWDLAATEKKMAGDDPDFTACTLTKLVDGVLYILDCQAVRVGPARVNEMMKNLAQQDAAAAKREGAEYMVRWEREGGSSGKRDNLTLVRLLVGYNARGVRPQGDKVTRAKPLASQVLAGNVKVVAGEHTEMFLKAMHGFPDLSHDDIPDSAEVSTRPLLRLAGGKSADVEEERAGEEAA